MPSRCSRQRHVYQLRPECIALGGVLIIGDNIRRSRLRNEYHLTAALHRLNAPRPNRHDPSATLPVDTCNTVACTQSTHRKGTGMAEPAGSNELGLMQGYPAPAEKLVTLENMRRPPYNRWAFQHIRELTPTVEIWRGDGPIVPLDIAPRDLDSLPVQLDDGSAYTVADMLDIAYADAIVVLHQGRLVYERYRNGMRPHSQHQMMSVTKSLVGTLALQLAHEGLIDLNAPVSRYLPELSSCAWTDATVRHALDMSTGIAFDEIYDDLQSDIGRYAVAAGFNPPPEGYSGPRNLAEALPTWQKRGEHGYAFHYVTPNTDVIGWIIARVSGKPFSQLCSERIWSRLGAERDAYIIRDQIGMEMTGGGLNATARDLARFGQMLLQNGSYLGQQIIAPEVVADIHAGGDQEVFARGAADWGPLWANWSYRSFWWYTHNAHNAFTGIGIHGQWLYIDPTAQVVIVQQSSYPSADQPDADPVTLAAFHAIAQTLRE